jgi:hypothetical protein
VPCQIRSKTGPISALLSVQKGIFPYPVNRIEEFLLFTPMCRSSSGAKLSQESAKKRKEHGDKIGSRRIVGGSIPFKILPSFLWSRCERARPIGSKTDSQLTQPWFRNLIFIWSAIVSAIALALPSGVLLPLASP